MAERVVLAYSGGLDTSVGIGWLKDATGKEVVALAVDVGQGGEDMDDIRQRALDCGAVESIVVDAKEEFAADYLMPALKANAMYQKTYPLVSALSRPLISKHLAQTARSLGADSVAHGCTGKGNDQVRFEAAVAALGTLFWQTDDTALYAAFIVTALLGCSAWFVTLGRGPLEQALTTISTRAATAAPHAAGRLDGDTLQEENTRI